MLHTYQAECVHAHFAHCIMTPHNGYKPKGINIVWLRRGCYLKQTYEKTHHVVVSISAWLACDVSCIASCLHDAITLPQCFVRVGHCTRLCKLQWVKRCHSSSLGSFQLGTQEGTWRSVGVINLSCIACGPMGNEMFGLFMFSVCI